MMLVKDYMTPMPHTIEPHQSLGQVHEKMKEWHIRHLPVLSGGQLVGVLAERDMEYLATFPGVDLKKAIVEHAMGPEVFTVTAERPVSKVAAEMLERRFGSAVVVDEHGKVIGIFTTTDALKILATLKG